MLQSTIKYTLPIVFGLVLSQWGHAASPPAAVRAVQIAAFAETQATDIKLAEIDSIEQRAIDLGFSPVWRHTVDRDAKGVWTLLLVGRLETLPDAIVLKHSLRRHGFEGAFEKAFPDLVQGDFNTECATPDKPLIYPENYKTSRYMDYVRPDVSSIKSDLDRKISSRDYNSAIAHAQAIIESNDNSAEVRSWAMMERGLAIIKRDVLKQGTVDEPESERKARLLNVFNDAIPMMMRVAKCEVIGSHEDQMDARWRIADLHHEVLANKVKAYQCYKEILEYNGSNPAVRARARVEIAATLLELARSDAAYFNEVRRACELITETVPQSFRRAQAVAYLMYGESFYYEGLPSEAIRHLTGFATRYPDRVREQTAANVCIALSHKQLGNTEKGMEVLAANLLIPVSGAERFYWRGVESDMCKLSAHTLKKWASEVGDTRYLEVAQYYISNRLYKDGQPADDYFPLFNHDQYFEEN